MKLWLDAQLSPKLCAWLNATFPVEAYALRDLGLCDSEDQEIFLAAKQAKAVVMTKDIDFMNLLDRYGMPPQIIWITCGNSSNNYLKQILATALPQVLVLLASGEKFVEISEPW
jgi:predicted nuclease of predicted toxin-antitoxin system